MLGNDWSAPWMCFGSRRGGGGGGGGDPPLLPPKMLGSMPIHSANDAYNVFKMDAISDCLSGYATHPKYEEICAQMLDACGVDASLFDLFEASLAPAERGNLVDMVEDLQLQVDFSDVWERYTELVWPKMEMVLDALEITEGNHGPPIEHGCLHSCHIAITCVLCPPPSPTQIHFLSSPRWRPWMWRMRGRSPPTASTPSRCPR